jgi:hypothetical protein
MRLEFSAVYVTQYSNFLVVIGVLVKGTKIFNRKHTIMGHRNMESSQLIDRTIDLLK